MLADPITIAAASPTPELVLRVVKSDGYGSERRDTANGYVLVTNHQASKAGVSRHYLKLSKTMNVESPFSGIVTPVTCAASLTLAVPAFGFDDTASAAIAQALINTISDSEFTLARWVGWQS